MIAILYLDMNAFVFFISQPDLVYFFSLSFVAGAGGCLEREDKGTFVCHSVENREEPHCQVPNSASAVVITEGYLPLSWSTLTFVGRRKCKRKVLYKC